MRRTGTKAWTVILIVLSVSLTRAGTPVHTGADRLLADCRSLIAQKRIGLVTNHTGRLSDGSYLVDALIKEGMRVTVLFGPEHGIRGEDGAGDAVGNSADPITGIPIYSLYGSTTRPTPEMLDSIDMLVYDIQDVGVRFYTYISTMKLCMDAAAAQGIPMVVLDRPNPLRARIDGPIIEDSLRSFVGIVQIPVVYGMTAGELAVMMNERGWLDGGERATLTVVWMDGWSRAMGSVLSWVPPSPNIKFAETVEVYPATCFIEATAVSEGRGTDQPFHQFGAPWIDAGKLVARLASERLPGVSFDTISFVPVSSKHKGRRCQGARVTVTHPESFRPSLTGVTILSVLEGLYPDSLRLSHRSLNRLLGINRAYEWIKAGKLPPGLEESWLDELQAYREAIQPYLHYPSF